ncbi:uncharacterized protein [Epargyreus clarus]|uniref:uncharacterized protein n=1 Tax=Epargyreus clarus TaxID=520877 RepID=UPI003C2F5C28
MIACKGNVLLLITLLTLHLNLCYCRERYKTNTDFLLHEAGGVPDSKRNYESQFPSLNPPSKPLNQQNANSYTTATTSIGTTSKPSSPKRDYVAPNFPPLKPPTTPPKPNINPNPNTQVGTTPKSPSAPKRDYVAPQFTTTKPIVQNNQPGGGKVKDLVNFYDSKDKNQGITVPTKPSYSSILHDPKATQGSTLSTPSTQFTAKPGQTGPKMTPKPMSYSDILSGSNKNQPPPSPGQKLGLPNSSGVKPPATNTVNVPTPKPNTPVLPSSLANTNTNNNKNGPSDIELQTLSEELLRKDVNNAAKYVTVNYQEKTTSFTKEDKAPQPLLTIAPDAWNIPTIQKFLPLLDNYERDTLVNEYVTPQERNEENAFMDAIMATTVMRHLMNFLKDKGYVTQDPKQQRDFVKQMWFGLYSRGKGKISSSGFEHIFVSELKNGEVSGLHNWIYFSKEEAANRANYLGYLKYVEMNDKGVVMKLHFSQQGVDKPVDSMFIGTSPELEMAVYTLCFVTRAGEECKLKLGNKDVDIVTHNFRYRSKNYIGSAYPQI